MKGATKNSKVVGAKGINWRSVAPTIVINVGVTFGLVIVADAFLSGGWLGLKAISDDLLHLSSFLFAVSFVASIIEN